MTWAVEGDRDVDRRQWRYLVIALAVAAVVWVVLFAFRVQAHQPNVDDYLYAYTARSLYQAGDPFTAVLHTGQTSPLVPALAALGVAAEGIYGGIAVELPLLLLLVAGSFVLARTWLSPMGALIVALLAGLNIEVLGYSMMLNFAIASSAAVIWCFVSYIRSDHLRNWRWSLTFGIAMAALALSRSLAPVYVAPLVVVVVCDYVLDVRRNGTFWRRPALLAVGSLLVLAGPWWLVSGHEALHYLLNAGYNPSAGYVSRGFGLTPSGIKARVTYELVELGWFESYVLGLAVLAAVVLSIVCRHRLNARSMWMLVAWSVLTILLLSTSTNVGTAFGLPVLVVVIVACGGVLGQFPSRALRVAMVPLAAVAVVGFAYQFTGSRSEWWPGAKYSSEVVLAGGTSRSDVGLITQQVANAVRGDRTVVARDDAIVNINGLSWELGTYATLLDPTSSSTETAAAIGYLSRANALITGASVFPYAGSLNQTAIEKAAFADGYHPERLWTVGQSDTIIVWRRGSGGTTSHILPPVTALLRPKSSGTTVHGAYWLDARASAFLGLAGVKFEITGGTLQHAFVVTGAVTPYGWIGGWDTTNFPNGVYTIRSVAEDSSGQTTRSAPVVVRVEN